MQVEDGCLVIVVGLPDDVAASCLEVGGVLDSEGTVGADGSVVETAAKPCDL